MQKVTELITSRHNALLTLTASLSDRKHRRAEGLFRFDGRKLFAEALQADLPLFAVLLKESSAAQISDFARDHDLPDGCRAVLLPDALFDRISEEKSPDGVICLSKSLDKIHKIITIDKRMPKNAPHFSGRMLLLESVRDPGNLGTIIRSARAFGIDDLVLSADCADIYNPRTIRAAMGTLFTQRITVVDDLAGLITALREARSIYAAALDHSAVRLGEVVFGARDAVVIGNEGHGLSAAVLGACTRSIYIPMEQGVESLNAGVAASVLLWELYRGK